MPRRSHEALRVAPKLTGVAELTQKSPKPRHPEAAPEIKNSALPKTSSDAQENLRRRLGLLVRLEGLGVNPLETSGPEEASEISETSETSEPYEASKASAEGFVEEHFESFIQDSSTVANPALLMESQQRLTQQHRRRRAEKSAADYSITSVMVAPAAPLLCTTQRHGSSLNRLLRQRRVDRSENLGLRYATRLANSEELYKFSWLREALEVEPEDPRLWYRQRRPARLQDYTLRRDEELWWRERLQERRRLMGENYPLSEELWALQAQGPQLPPALRQLQRSRLPYSLLTGLLTLEGQLPGLLPTLEYDPEEEEWPVAEELLSLGLLSGSGPLGQLLRRSDWSPRPLPAAGPVYQGSWRHEESLEWLNQENRQPLEVPWEGSGQLRVRAAGRGPGGHAFSARHYLRRLMRRLSMRLILSPRRNNVYVVLQPDRFSGRAGESIFQRTAGEQSRFKGRLRRSRQNREQLYGLAAFKLLRFHKQNSRYRFLRVVLKSFHSTLTRRHRSGFQRQRYLRNLLFPFTHRQLAHRYPLVNLTLQGYSYQPKRQTRRSKKHPRPPKNKSYI